MMLNDGKPALSEINKMAKPPILDPEHENAGVEVIKEEDGDGEGAFGDYMIPNYKEKMAGVIAMLDKQSELRQLA